MKKQGFKKEIQHRECLDMTEKLTSLSIDDMERIIDVLRNQHTHDRQMYLNHDELADKLHKMIHDSIEEPWRFHYND